jgi:branched-chain amino acid transport system substrate-binding protein
MVTRRFLLQSAAAAAAYSAQGFRGARAANAPGVTDTEIKIGQTMPYSGPASAWGVIGRAELAYFKMINDQGGVNGRKINLISLDDAYSPSNTVEQTRRLIEQERVAFIFGSLGGYTNLAVRQYLNDNKIPHVFLAVAADIVGDPEHYPWTIGANPAISSEVHIYAKYILATKPNAKIGVLYQHDGVFRIFVAAMREGLGAANAALIVGEASYELSEPTVDSQIISLQASGADTLIIGANPKAAAQAIRKAYDLGWSPDRFLFNGSSGIVTTLKPAGLEKSKGVITAGYVKHPNDPRWKNDPGMKEWEAFAAKYLSTTDFKDGAGFYGFDTALVLIQVLKQCGDDLSRDNIMRQALNIKDFVTPNSLPGASINTSPTNYFPRRQLHLGRFNGEVWEPFGELMTD